MGLTCSEFQEYLENTILKFRNTEVYLFDENNYDCQYGGTKINVVKEPETGVFMSPRKQYFTNFREDVILKEGKRVLYINYKDTDTVQSMNVSSSSWSKSSNNYYINKIIGIDTLLLTDLNQLASITLDDIEEIYNKDKIEKSGIIFYSGNNSNRKVNPK